MSELFERVARFSFHRAGRVLLLATFVSILCAGLATRLEFHASYDELLPDHSVEVRDLKHVSEKAGSAWYVVIAVDRHSTGESSPGLALETTKKWAQDLARELDALPLVHHTEVRLPLEFLGKRRLLFLSVEELRNLTKKVEARIDRAKLEASPFYLGLEDDDEKEPVPSLAELEEDARGDFGLSDYHLDKHGRYLYVLVKPTTAATNMSDSRRLFQSLDAAIEAFRAKSELPLATRYGGAHFVHLAENDAIEADLQRGSLLALVLSCLVVVGFTRRPRTLVVVLLPLICALCATFCLTYLLIGHVNILTGFLVGILLGIGVDFGIHMFVRYAQQRDAGLALEASVVNAALHTGRASLTSALTTAAAFFSLTFADFPGFSEFGLIAGMGVLLAFAATFVLFPAITALLERHWPLRPRATRGGHATGANVPRGAAWLVCSMTVAVTAIGVVSLPRVDFEIDLDVVRGQNEAFAFDRYIESSQEARVTPALILVDSLESATRVERIVEQVKAELGERSGIEGVVSQGSLIPRDQAARLEVIAELRRILADPALDRLEGDERKTLLRAREWADVTPFGAEDLPNELRRRFQTNDGQGNFVLVFGDYDEASIDAAMDWAVAMDRVRQLAAEEGTSIHILSGQLISGRLFRLVIDEGPFVLWATMSSVLLVLLVDFRSLRRASLVMFPVVCGLIIIVGLMVLIGMKLNFLNVMVFPCIVGIAVDDTIHMLHRYGQLGPGSIRRVVGQTGVAAVLASVTTAVGFGSMMTAHHYGIFSLGLLAVIGITVVLFTSVVFFGAILRLLERDTR
jgi:uncharacterized protein